MALSFLQDTANSGLRHHGRSMKDTTSSDSHCDSPTSLIDSSHLSPPLSNGHMSSHAFPGLPHPLQFYPGSLVASQTAALLSGNPLHLHATLQHELYKWHNPVSPPLALTAAARRRNNNNHVTSSTPTAALVKKNKVNARRTKKVDMEMTPMVEPLSPPTSGSPPSGEKSSGERDAVNRDKVFTCGVCNRSFGYKHVLQNHERTHTGEKPFECAECHKRFTRDHHLKTHMRLHTGEKPYHCTHCDRQFVQVANLRRHLRVHTGERPYGCELCTSRFSDSNQLKAHMLIHKGEKPFGCEVCRGRFRRRHHMIHHKCPGGGNMAEQTRRTLEVGMEEDIDDEEDIEEDEDVRRGLIIAHNNNKVEKKGRSRKTQDIRRVIRMPSTSSPLLSSNAALVLPVQTEPEDLSMSTGTGNMFGNGNLHRSHHSHSSGDSPMSRSPSSEADEDMDEEDEVPPTSTSLFLQHRHPKFRRHLQHGGTAPVS